MNIDPKIEKWQSLSAEIKKEDEEDEKLEMLIRFSVTNLLESRIVKIRRGYNIWINSLQNWGLKKKIIEKLELGRTTLMIERLLSVGIEKREQNLELAS